MLAASFVPLKDMDAVKRQRRGIRNMQQQWQFHMNIAERIHPKEFHWSNHVYNNSNKNFTFQC